MNYLGFPGGSVVKNLLANVGTWVRFLVWEDPTHHGATKPVSCNYGAHEQKLLQSMCLEPLLHNERSHHREKPALQLE